MKNAKGAIGLWSEIVVKDCPYCHARHVHGGTDRGENVKPGDIVLSGCGQGKYQLDCSRKSLNFTVSSQVDD